MSYFWDKRKLFILISIAVLAVFAENEVQESSDAHSALEELAKKFETWAENLKMDTDELMDRPFIKELRENLNKAVENFKAQIPTDMGNMQAYAEKAKKGVEDIMGQLKSMPLSDEAKQMKEYSSKLYDEAKNALNNFKKKFN